MLGTSAFPLLIVFIHSKSYLAVKSLYFKLPLLVRKASVWADWLTLPNTCCKSRRQRPRRGNAAEAPGFLFVAYHHPNAPRSRSSAASPICIQMRGPKGKLQPRTKRLSNNKEIKFGRKYKIMCRNKEKKSFLSSLLQTIFYVWKILKNSNPISALKAGALRYEGTVVSPQQ